MVRSARRNLFDTKNKNTKSDAHKKSSNNNSRSNYNKNGSKNDLHDKRYRTSPSSSSKSNSNNILNQDQSTSALLPSNIKLHTKCLVTIDNNNQHQRWYEYGTEYNERNATIRTHPPPSSINNNSNTNNTINMKALIHKYRTIADVLYGHEIQLFQKETTIQNNNKNSDFKWIESTMKHGTIKDRVAAMSVVISTNPIHQFYIIDGLFQMMGCSTTPTTTNTTYSGSHPHQHHHNKQTNYRVAQLAAEAVEDLFLRTLLPTHRKLLTLADRPLYLYESSFVDTNSHTDDNDKDTNNNDTETTKKKKKNKNKNNNTTKQSLSPRILLLWRYEELIKERYQLFIQQYLSYTMMNSTDHNVIDMHKVSAIKMAATLLRTVPEGEIQLLQMIVNKIGDPNKKISSCASHELRIVLQSHPVMQHVIAREVQQLVHRPNLSYMALYKCIIFLNQLKLTKSKNISTTSTTTSTTNNNATEERNNKNNQNKIQQQQPESLAASLVATYFRLFEIAIQQTFHHHPSSGTTTTKSTSKKDKMKKGSISSNKNKNYKNSTDDSTNNNNSNAMKSRLLSALLTGVNRAHPYLPIHDQSILMDHIDSLYRVVHTSQPSAITQSLLLLFHVTIGTPTTTTTTNNSVVDDDNTIDHDIQQQQQQQRTKQQDRFYRGLYSTLSNTNMLLHGGTKHLTMYFNLLYKAMKYDTIPIRIIIVCKKLFCMSLHCPSNILTATIFLINELCTIHPTILVPCYTQQQVWYGMDSLRVLDPTKREPRGALRLIQNTKNNNNNNNNNKNDNTDIDKDTDTHNNTIDEYKTRVPGWEIHLALHHFHPSVRMFAKQVSSLSMNNSNTNKIHANGNNSTIYTGDPLRDFATTTFLDKFAYKNPKKTFLQRTTSTTETTTTNGTTVVGVRTDHQQQQQLHATNNQRIVPFNDPSFLNQTIDNDNIHDEFFYTFFQERAKRESMKEGSNIQKDTKSKKNKQKKNASKDNNDDNDDADDEIDALYRHEPYDGGDNNNDEKMKNVTFDWETDSEEEAFVDALSQKVLEDACGNELDFHELDAEDPDMDDWDDDDDVRDDDNGRVVDDDDGTGHDDDDDDDDDAGDDDDDYDNFALNGGAIVDDDDDDDADSDVDNIHEDHDNDNGHDNNDDDNDDDDAFMDNDDDTDDDDNSEEEYDHDKEPAFFAGNDDDDDDDDDDIGLVDDDDDDDDDNNDDAEVDEDDVTEENVAVASKSKTKSKSSNNNKTKKKGGISSLPTFASVEHYEELINSSWKKRSNVTTAASTDSDDDDDEEVGQQQQTINKRDTFTTDSQKASSRHHAKKMKKGR